MAITRTINYTQNVPQTLGFSNVLTAAAGDVLTVTFDFATTSAHNMGQFIFTETAGVSQVQSYAGVDETIVKTLTLTGTTANLNTCMNTGVWQNHYYECDNIVQNLLTQDRTLPSDFRGEVQIQISPDCVHGLTVGASCKLASLDGTPIVSDYVVTKIDSANSATRIWMIFKDDYAHNENWFAGTYKTPVIGGYLKNSAGTNITPINDLAYINPHGTTSVGCVVKNGATTIDSGTISLVGSFFIAEPYFTTLPPTTISTSTVNTTYNLNLGAIAQADGNYQSIQLLLKFLPNDPLFLDVFSYDQLGGYPSAGTEEQKLQFIADAINTKVNTGKAYYYNGFDLGEFSTVQTDIRISTSHRDGIIRWDFYGTPDECNLVLAAVPYYRPADITRDLGLETRIINGRTRIYNTRGI